MQTSVSTSTFNPLTEADCCQAKERGKLTLGWGNVGVSRCATTAFTTSNRDLQRLVKS